jgi:hypothetical protein
MVLVGAMSWFERGLDWKWALAETRRAAGSAAQRLPQSIAGFQMPKEWIL